jgi:ubiquinone/menaquinone biosynthesis C-methylase UbiE
MAEFDGWAEYYDLIHQGVPGDTEFYVAEAARAGGEVLELGAGTGRVAIPLILAGIDVVGLDNSGAMLALCREKQRYVAWAPGRLLLVQADVKALPFNARFSCALMAYRTFMHLLTAEEQRQCLKTIRRHLTRGGTLILDTWAPAPATLVRLRRRLRAGKPALVERFPLPEERLTVVHYHEMRLDEPRQLLIEEHTIQETGDAGNVLREVHLPLVRRWTAASAMKDLFECCGFAIQEVYGDFQRTRLTDRSTDTIWIVTRTR